MCTLSTVENDCLEGKIDFWRPLLRLWRGMTAGVVAPGAPSRGIYSVRFRVQGLGLLNDVRRRGCTRVAWNDVRDRQGRDRQGRDRRSRAGSRAALCVGPPPASATTNPLPQPPLTPEPYTPNSNPKPWTLNPDKKRSDRVARDAGGWRAALRVNITWNHLNFIIFVQRNLLHRTIIISNIEANV